MNLPRKTQISSPNHESRRLAALHSYGLLDSKRETVFDHITQFAAEICGTPIALISLVDATRQWFKSNHGLDSVTETSREVSFCAHAIDEPGLMVIPDAQADDRFANNPLVTQDPNMRFYAGMPLTTADGYSLGTLCVIDREARKLSAIQRQTLEKLAHLVVDLFELRSRTHSPNTDQLLELLDGAKDELYLFDVETLKLIFANETARRHLGYDRIALLGLTPGELYPQLDEASFRNLLAPLVTGERHDVVLDTVQANSDASQYAVRARFVLAEAGTFKAYMCFSTAVGGSPANTSRSNAATGSVALRPKTQPATPRPSSLASPSADDDGLDKGSARKVKILQTAEWVLMDEGYAGFSLRKVAKRAGVSIGNLQYYFPTRAELLDGMMESLLGSCMSHYQRHIVVIPNPQDRLMECATYLLSDSSQQGMFQILREMWALAVHDEDAAASVAEFTRSWQAMQATMIRDVNPELSPERADALAAVAVAMLSGSFVTLSNAEQDESERIRAEVMHALMKLPTLG